MTCIFSSFYGHCASRALTSLGDSGYHLQTAFKLGFLASKNLLCGTTLGLFSLATCGMRQNTSHHAEEMLFSIGLLTVQIYTELLQTLNPEAEVPDLSSDPTRSREPTVFIPPQYFAVPKNPLLAATHFVDCLLIKISNQAHRYSQSSDCLERWIYSRELYIIFALSATIATVARAALGITALFFSFLTVGYFPCLNAMAAEGLLFPIIFADLLYSSLNLIHPGSL